MNKKLINTIAVVALCLFAVLLAAYFIKTSIHNEATKAKTEVIEKVKLVKDVDTDSAAKSVAGTIHKFTSFKDKVKKNLKALDSADSIKK